MFVSRGFDAPGFKSVRSDTLNPKPQTRTPHERRANVGFTELPTKEATN